MPHPPHRTPWHKNWRTWVIVLLMLAGMGIYVLTLDDPLAVLGFPRSAPTPAGAPAR